MQRIAAEFHYSESTFVLPPEDRVHTAGVRIFTPRDEIPFAGHPNVGTALRSPSSRSARASGSGRGSYSKSGPASSPSISSRAAM
jgi:trans-2,3-dihydro-3-hydroxyanthranilate isomerase